MSIKLQELQKREPITTILPIPSSESMLERYRLLQQKMEQKQFRTLHSFARERIEKLIIELEELFEKQAV